MPLMVDWWQGGTGAATVQTRTGAAANEERNRPGKQWQTMTSTGQENTATTQEPEPKRLQIGLGLRERICIHERKYHL